MMGNGKTPRERHTEESNTFHEQKKKKNIPKHKTRIVVHFCQLRSLTWLDRDLYKD